MSLQDLKDQGVLLPESEWGSRSLEGSVPRRSIAALLAVAVVALATAYAGEGGALTWVGMGAYLLDFAAIWLVLDRATRRQRRRTGGGGA